jgi:hypothetical protein
MWYPIGGKRCRDANQYGGYLAAESDTEIKWITICPTSFNDYKDMVPPSTDYDVSASGRFIENLRPLSTVLFHEYLHQLYPDFSK